MKMKHDRCLGWHCSFFDTRQVTEENGGIRLTALCTHPDRVVITGILAETLAFPFDEANLSSIGRLKYEEPQQINMDDAEEMLLSYLGECIVPY